MQRFIDEERRPAAIGTPFMHRRKKRIGTCAIIAPAHGDLCVRSLFLSAPARLFSYRSHFRQTPNLPIGNGLLGRQTQRPADHRRMFRANALVNRMLDFARERPGKPVQVNIAFQVKGEVLPSPRMNRMPGLYWCDARPPRGDASRGAFGDRVCQAGKDHSMYRHQRIPV